MIKEYNLYEKTAKKIRKKFSWILKENSKSKEKIKKVFTDEYIENLNFSGLDVEPYEILLFAYTIAILSFLFFLFIDIFILIFYKFEITSIDFLTFFLMLAITIAFPIIIMNIISNYPKSYARYMKIHSLGDIPEILSYVVMYLKLVPNLENSVKFAASESNTSLSFDLKKMLWDMEIRIYHGVDNALTNFATQWGRRIEYFKMAQHLIRSSIQEKEEASRNVTLNRALDVALDGTKDMMNKFANKLHQPAMVIYSIGIMIPLALVAMLPAAGLVGMKITIFQVFFLYNIILPTFVFLYTRKILLTRPATFNPPNIPKNHPDIYKINKKRRFIIAFSMGFILTIPGLIFLLMPYFFSSSSSNKIISFLVSPNGLNSFFPVTLFIIWGFTAMISIYCISVYRPYKRIRDEIKDMETEFSDALYILGKRISEEKSPEESFIYTANTMQGASISKVFAKTGYNLTAMHSNLRDSMFNDEYGSLKYVYSNRIKAIMLLFVEGIQKSQKAVSVSIIKIADHLKELQSIEKKIKDMLFNLTSTLRSTVAVFAPLIGGVTLSITKLITNILGDLSKKMPSADISGISQIPSISTSFTLDNIRTEYFVLVIGIYIIELVILLVRFTNGIDEGDDKASYMYNLGRMMPTSIFVFSITVILGQILFANIFIN